MTHDNDDGVNDDDDDDGRDYNWKHAGILLNKTIGLHCWHMFKKVSMDGS